MEKVIIEGVVEHGRRLGRELGFPTANVAVPDSVAAKDGVYRSRAEVDGAVYDAMSNPVSYTHLTLPTKLEV